jgi:hypothetical protein
MESQSSLVNAYANLTSTVESDFLVFFLGKSFVSRNGPPKA